MVIDLIKSRYKVEVHIKAQSFASNAPDLNEIEALVPAIGALMARLDEQVPDGSGAEAKPTDRKGESP